MYCEMLGFDASFGHIIAVNMTQQNALIDKRVGYLACSVLLHENHELMIMITNSFRRVWSAFLLMHPPPLPPSCVVWMTPPLEGYPRGAHSLHCILPITPPQDLKDKSFLVVAAALNTVCHLLNVETIPVILPLVLDLLKHPSSAPARPLTLSGPLSLPLLLCIVSAK